MHNSIYGGKEDIINLYSSANVASHYTGKNYCICSIRHPGYCLFHHTILCSFYSRVATNREWRLLNSVLSVKSFLNVRALRKASFARLTKNYDAVTWFWSKPSSCYKAVPTRHLQSVSSFSSSNDFTRWSPSAPQKMPNLSGQPSRNVTNNLISSLHTCGKTVMLVPSSSTRQCTSPKTGFHTAL